MVRLTVNEAKDYIGKTCFVISDGCLIEDKIIGVDSQIHLERCSSRDIVYVIKMGEVCGPLQKDRVKVGDTGVFFDILNDLVLLRTYRINTVQGISSYVFTDWPYLSDDGKFYRYFLPMKEIPDDLHNL